jgi:hypothetical protein
MPSFQDGILLIHSLLPHETRYLHVVENSCNFCFGLQPEISQLPCQVPGKFILRIPVQHLGIRVSQFNHPAIGYHEYADVELQLIRFEIEAVVLVHSRDFRCQVRPDIFGSPVDIYAVHERDARHCIEPVQVKYFAVNEVVQEQSREWSSAGDPSPGQQLCNIHHQ